MKDTDIQWHPGFVAAMDLELIKNRNDLKYEKEYNLNTKPLEIDLLIIKKKANVHIANEIGRLFKGHNILEYKSPRDHLNIDTLYKVWAYAGLYKSYGKIVDQIQAEDVTVSIIRETKPEGLFQYLKKHEYMVSEPYQGIYYIEGNVIFPTQIVVTGELESKTHIWLKALSEEIDEQDMRELLKNVKQFTGAYDRELASSVLEVSAEANRQVIEKLIGDDSMSQVLMELMEPQLLLREKKGMEKGMEKGIQGTVDVLRDLEIPDEVILQKLQEKFKLSKEEAAWYV